MQQLDTAPTIVIEDTLFSCRGECFSYLDIPALTLINTLRISRSQANFINVDRAYSASSIIIEVPLLYFSQPWGSYVWV